MATAIVESKPLFFPNVRDQASFLRASRRLRSPSSALSAMASQRPAALKNVVEGGWVEETGFVWLVIREAQKHHFEKANPTAGTTSSSLAPSLREDEGHPRSEGQGSGPFGCSSMRLWWMRRSLP
ncbi:hypothetical protein L7F22_052517 [Adiantum nelumboides]|nr:hypothetical protein [Adiantum nelumboides]